MDCQRSDLDASSIHAVACPWSENLRRNICMVQPTNMGKTEEVQPRYIFTFIPINHCKNKGTLFLYAACSPPIHKRDRLVEARRSGAKCSGRSTGTMCGSARLSEADLFVSRSVVDNLQQQLSLHRFNHSSSHLQGANHFRRPVHRKK